MSTKRKCVPLTFAPREWHTGPIFDPPRTFANAQIVAGPFETDEELRQALELLINPVAGNA